MSAACLTCGRRYEQTRSDQKYCSIVCRKKRWEKTKRGRQKSGAAKRELNLDGEDGLYGMMEGIAWNSEHAEGLMDEHPLAYKDIQQVMQDQEDLCEAVGFIRPVLNYKGA